MCANGNSNERLEIVLETWEKALVLTSQVRIISLLSNRTDTALYRSAEAPSTDTDLVKTYDVEK